MNNPESIVKNFIEDYFLWNNQSIELSDKIRLAEISALSAIGINESIAPHQIENISQYAEIKAKYSAQFQRLFEQADLEYKKIIAKYCRPNYQHLAIAFGSESAHNPENETIISIKTGNDKSIVKTKRLRKILQGEKTYTDDFEFHLTNENDCWYLEQIYYVDEEGKYKGL